MRVLLLMLLVLPACATYEPVPLDPPGIMEELRDLRVDLPESGLLPTNAVALALVNNPGLRVWRRDHQIAAGLVISRSAWDNPELRVSLDNLYSRLGDSFMYALALRFFPPFPGELDAKRERALARERRVLAKIEVRESRIALDTRLAHARLVLLDTDLAIVRAGIRLNERTDATVRTQIEAGLMTRLDETLVLLRREELANELQTLTARRRVAESELAALLGASPDASIEVRSPPAAPPPTGLSQSALEDQALAHRPDLRALAEAYAEREQQLRLLHFARIPWPRHVQPGFAGISDDTSFDVGLAMEVPILDTGEAKIAVAESRRDRARDAYRARLHLVRHEIRLALLDLEDQNRRRHHLTDRQGPILRKAEADTRAALKAGAADVLAVVAIEARVLAARRAAARTAHDYECATVRLAAATGRILAPRQAVHRKYDSVQVTPFATAESRAARRQESPAPKR